MWLSPLSWLLVAFLLVLAAATVAPMRWRRRLHRTGAVLGLLAGLAMTPLFANGLLHGLENRLSLPGDCATNPPALAVVLAGGVSGRAVAADDVSVLEVASRRRVEGAVAWWRSSRGRHLLMSGGSWFNDGIPESRLMAEYARRLGVPATAIRTEDASTTTWDSARRLASIRPAIPRRMVLVTSAVHVPRAAYALREAGFDVCALAVDRRYLPFELPGYLIPQRSALEKTESALHELVGILYYRWLSASNRS